MGCGRLTFLWNVGYHTLVPTLDPSLVGMIEGSKTTAVQSSIVYYEN